MRPLYFKRAEASSFAKVPSLIQRTLLENTNCQTFGKSHSWQVPAKPQNQSIFQTQELHNSQVEKNLEFGKSCELK